MRPSDSNKIFKAALSRKSLPTPAVHCIWSWNVLCTALTLCLAREASSWLRRLADRLMRSSQSIDSSFILCWMSGVAKCFAATRPLPVLSTRSITGWRPCSSMSSFYNNTPQAVKEFWWKAASLSHLSTPAAGESILKSYLRHDMLSPADKSAAPCCCGVCCLHSLMHFNWGNNPQNGTVQYCECRYALYTHTRTPI